MKKHIYDSSGIKLLRQEEAMPQCGDYCDACGDCLSCYSEDLCPCAEDGKHFWVEYENDDN